MKTICWQCNNEMELLHQTVSHTLANKKISVHNVPLYTCSTCNNAFYVMSQKLEECLEEAFLQGKSEVLFEG